MRIGDAAGLPVGDVLDELFAALGAPTDREGPTAILTAPPGAGKTTIVPLALLDQPWCANRTIVMLEPRRLAARAAATRMAALLGERVGDTVGYQTRDERRIGPATRIEVLTEGILTRRLQRDPSLDGVAAVIFDEVHERNLPTDLGLALLLDARAALRPELRVLLMSATPDTAALARAVGDVPVIASDGRLHPVDIRWTPPRRGERPDTAIVNVIRTALRDTTTEPGGDVLVFLPGIGEIRRVMGALVADDVDKGVVSRLDGVDVYALAGSLSPAEQDAALMPSLPGRRRVVLATDIAESSLTVDGVRIVIDAGLARVPRLDLRTGMTRLTTVSASRASADQRAGRAGRLGPGVAYRLWSKAEHTARPAHLPAEITQVDLAGLALELAIWGTPADQLRFIDPPPSKALTAAHGLLVRLGAVGDSGGITTAGRAMATLPVHPRLARMVQHAADTTPGDLSLACLVATLVDERDVFRGRPADVSADLAERIDAARRGHHPLADRGSLQRAMSRASDVARRAGGTFSADDLDPAHTGRVLLTGFPDRLAVRRSQPGNFQLRTGTMAMTERSDPLADDQFVVAADLDGDRRHARIRLGASVDPADIVELLDDQMEHRVDVVWDRERGDVVERTEHRLGGMLIDQRLRPARPGPEATATLLERVRATHSGALGGDGAAALRARVALLRATFGDEWPDWSDRTLLATLDEWLAPYVAPLSSVAELQALDIAGVLTADLGWDRSMALAELAPPDLVTASGRAVPIDYTRAAPTASVRVQDLFGTSAHPTVAGGRVTVTLELLSPSDRPVQITADLPGFWAGSWAEVRKEMAGRYPKHHWPADPATAAPRRLKGR